ncbi:uncharacterized protein EDB91DRAFT_1077768 [Suillus paluster]|uniref:uncharacterized protein n=1 Tax=Suillus paluster TaxID=48578 RepID=UPI001B87B44E|nr:uncharacterized protein EDB91DRAFT_1077768 [Suillus paluster]KAG1752340.1 hypothetical protein EDB91DRAFT_1077768 [Suillus paluster]
MWPRLVKWWGDFVPIDQWEPLRVQSRFQHLQFRRYDMSPETQIETLDSHIRDSTPDEYECSFAGVEESIQELADMFDKSWGMSKPSTPEQSADGDKEVNGLVDDNPSYDLGWNIPSAALSSNPSPSVDDNTRDDDDDEGPGYDLRWGPNVTSAQPPEVMMDEDDVPACDLGWGSTHSGEQPIQQDVIIGASDGHTYDLGWGQAPVGEHWMKEDDDDDEPLYNLRWGSTPVSEHPMQQEVVDLTDEDGPSYNLWWGEHQVRSTALSPLSPIPASLGPMDLDADDREGRSYSEAEDVILWEKRQLNTISSNMTDQHVYAIIKNAVHDCNLSWGLAQILMDNWHILGGFTEA